MDNKKAFSLLHDAAYMLALESEGRVTKKQFDDWRTVWMNELGRLLIEMLEEQGKEKVIDTELPAKDN